MGANEDEGICYPQPQNLQQRVAIANDFTSRFDYELPMVVDAMENPAEEAYFAWPERLYVVGPDFKIAFKGGVGPFGFKPKKLAKWLERNYGADSD